MSQTTKTLFSANLHTIYNFIDNDAYLSYTTGIYVFQERVIDMTALVACSGDYLQDDIAGALRRYLPDYKVIVTDSGEECMEIVWKSCSDVVILGLEPADGFGLDVIEQIRGFSSVPILVLSRMKDARLVARTFDMGADGYMTVPVRQLEFIARIRAIIKINEISIFKEGLPIQ